MLQFRYPGASAPGARHSLFEAGLRAAVRSCADAGGALATLLAVLTVLTVWATPALAQAPTISNVMPITGGVAGGTNVQVDGSNYVAGSTSVTIGGTTIPAANVTVASATSLSFTTPAHAAGNVAVTVTTPNGTSGAAAGGFTYVAANAPVITSMSPGRAPANAVNPNFVVLTGTGFEGVTAVRFGGVDATVFGLGADGSLMAGAPVRGEGTVDIEVVTPNGVNTPNAASKFTYYGAPTITSAVLDPIRETVLITGTNLFDVSMVLIDNVDSPQFPRNNTDDATGTSILAFWDRGQPPRGSSATIQVFTREGMVQAVAQGVAVTPTLSGISPATGSTAGGTTVTLTGAEFVAGSTSVTIGGTTIPAASVTVSSTTSLSFAAPAHAAGNVAVTVTTAGGTSAAVSGGFTYVAPTPAPTLSAISPAMGSTAGGTTVTLTGTNFVAGSTSVTLGETTVPASSVTVAAPTSLSFVTPARAAGTVAVTVTTAGGTSGAVPGGFTYQASANGPVVTRLNPTAQDVGPDDVTYGVIEGLRLSGATEVTFGGVRSEFVVVLNDESIAAQIPYQAGGTVDVIVTTPDGSSEPSAASRFTYIGAPIITSYVIDEEGPVAHVYGANFHSNNRVIFGNERAFQVFASDDGTYLQASWRYVDTNVPTPAAEPISICNSVGCAYATAPWRVQPTIGAASASFGPPSGGTRVSLTGTGFIRRTTTVTVGGLAAADLTIDSSTSLSFTTPAHAAGVVEIALTTRGGVATSSFTYAGTPTLGAITPSTVPLTGATGVTLAGTDFVPGQTVVRVGDVQVTPTAVTGTTVIFDAPAHAAGTVDVVVTTPVGTSGPIAGGLTYAVPTPAPTLSGISPTSGPVAGGTSVTLTGSGFVTGSTSVTIGGTTVSAAGVTVVSATSLSFTTPAHAAGDVAVTVTTPNGTSAPGSFTYVGGALPVVEMLPGVLQGYVWDQYTPDYINVTGSGFTGATGVAIGDFPDNEFFVLSDTQILVVAPNGQGLVDIRVTTPSGTSLSHARSKFLFINAPPQITSVIAENIGFYEGEYLGSVRLVGSGLAAMRTISVAGVPADQFSSEGFNRDRPDVTQYTIIPAIRTFAGANGRLSVSFCNVLGCAYGESQVVAGPIPTAISPSSASAVGGTSLVVTGTGFVAGSTSVVIGGITVPASSVTVSSPTSLTFAAPAHAAGAVDVFVKSGNVTSDPLPGGFTYTAVAGPTLSAMSPSVGPTAGGTSVTLSGADFITGSTSVSIGGVVIPAASVTVNSGSSLTFTTPAHAEGVAAVTVTTPSGVSAPVSGGFTYVAAPTLATLSPSSGAIAGGTVVTLTGTGFVAGATSVTIGGETVSASGVTVNSATSLTFVAPAHAAGSVDVTVATPGGVSSVANGAFIYYGAPTAAVLSPSVGGGVGGTVVTLTGTGFVPGSTSIRIGGVQVAASNVTVTGSTSLSFSTPAHAVGRVDLTVTTPYGTTAPLIGAFTYALPTATALSPSTGPTTGGTVVTLTGTGFAAGSTSVMIGGEAVPASAVTVASATSLTFATPAHAAGAVDVTVTTLDGTSAPLIGQFTYVLPTPAPTLTAISPASGSLTGGTVVTLTGTDFVAGSTSVTIGETTVAAASVTVASTTSLSFTTPAHAAGNVAVTVTTAGGTSAAVSGGFTYFAPTPASTLSAISPATGSTAGGTSVTLTGTDFVVGSTSVTIGGTTVAAANVTVASATSLTFATPAHAAGTVVVTVTTPNGTSSAVSGGFTYVAPTPAPALTAISPASGPTVGGTSVILTGTDFVAGSTSVTIGETIVPTASVTVSGATSLSFTTPAHVVGNVSVTVTTPNGTSAVVPGGFTYAAVSPPAPTTDAASVTVAYGSTANPVTLRVGGTAMSVDIASQAAHGVATASGLTITYMPNAGYGGPDSFTYTATGPGGVSLPGTVTVTVTPPTLTLDATALPAGRQGAAYSQTRTVSGGTGPYVYSIADGDLPAGLTLDGSIGEISGTPTTAGTSAFTVRARDASTGTGPYEALQPHLITVAASTPPVAGPVSLTVAAGSINNPVTLALTGGAAQTVAIATQASHGVATASGVTITYTPTAGYSGPDSFSYTATNGDGTSVPATVTITVSAAPPVVVAPIANAVSVTVAADSRDNPVALNMTGGTALTVAVANPPSHGSTSVTGLTISYTPNPGYSGPDSFTYTAGNAGGTSLPATVSLTVSPPTLTLSGIELSGEVGVAYSQAISAASGAAPYVFTLASGSDPLPPGLSFANGVLSGTPTAEGTFNLVVRATDVHGATGTRTYVLVIVPASPVIAAPRAGGVSATVDFGSIDNDIGAALSGGEARSVSIASSPANGSVRVSGLGFLYSPAAGFHGQDSFTYTASGPGGVSAPATVSVTVSPPTPPVIVAPTGPVVVPPLPPVTSGSPQAMTVDLSALVSGPIDGFRVTTTGFHGAVEIVQGGAAISSGAKGEDGALRAAGGGFRLVYRPAANFMGTETITLVAFGPGGDSRPLSFTFQVAGKAPDLSAQVASNGQVGLTPTAGLVGGPFQGLRITRAPAFGAAVVQGATIVFTPGSDGGGATSLDYVIDLPFGSSAAGRIDLVANRVPAAQALTARTLQGRAVVTRISDGAGGPFTAAAVVSVSPTTAGVATIANTGGAYDLTFAPTGAFAGEAVVTFSLANAFGTTNGVLTVMVEARADPGLNPDVRGAASGQVAAARRFTDAQVGNFQRRLQDLRNGTNASSNDLGLNLGFGMNDDMRDPRTALRQRLGMGSSRQNVSALDPDRERELLTAEIWAARARAGDVPVEDSVETMNFGSAGESPVSRAGALGFWTAGMVDWGRQDASGQRDTRFTTQGVSGGLDLRLDDRLIVGGGLGYGEDRSRIGESGAATDGQAITGALYASWRPTRSLYLESVLGFADLRFDTRRRTSAMDGGPSGQVEGERSGDIRFASLSVGQMVQNGGLSGDVYGRLDARQMRLDAFTETGGGLSSLTWDALSQDSLSANLGASLRWSLPTRRHGLFLPSIRLEWSHELKDIGLQGVRYADWAASPTYLVPLDAWSRESLNLNLGVEWTLSDRLALSLGYRAMVGDASSSQGGQIGLKYGW
ncbi:IPT/TIG domain-containing protein [Brevundimonas staleyi]|uniref:IPT/TIG domain-containing protein n=1 Tax=Brevundimonas staleyi TaxID=74326 RepID=A0ABW0FV66_9CAUL